MRSCSAAKAERNNARLSLRLPDLAGCSPWIEVPDRGGTGSARSASTTRTVPLSRCHTPPIVPNEGIRPAERILLLNAEDVNSRSTIGTHNVAGR